MKTLAIVYEEPNDQVFRNAASVAGISGDQARKAWGVMTCDAQPTIVDGREPEPLALNGRSIQTMLAIDGGGNGVNTRWLGVRYEPVDRGPINGGFLRPIRY